MCVDLLSKFSGCILGCATGDAIGELAFRYPSKEDLCSRIKNIPLLQYTDDTAMMIGLAQSMIKDQDIDQLNLGDMFKRNFNEEPWRGYASGPPTIFSMVQNLGITYVDAAHRLFGGDGSLGNGAAMRIAPVGLFFHQSISLYEKAAASAEITHAHPVGIDGAAVQARAVGMSVGLNPETRFSKEAFIQELIQFARTDEIREKMKLVEKMIEDDAPPDIAADRIGRTVAVQESMPFALYSFLRHPESMEDCLYCAVLNGGDRDTLGAMACSISGAYLGVDTIPLLWLKKLENRVLLEKLAYGLAEGIAVS